MFSVVVNSVCYVGAWYVLTDIKDIHLGGLGMGKFKRVELYDTFTVEHPLTGETIRVQALPGNNIISCRECLFRKKEFKKM